MLYLLNAPVLTAYGHWRFEGPLCLERARTLLADGYTSAIGHAGAARFLTLLGLHKLFETNARIPCDMIALRATRRVS